MKNRTLHLQSMLTALHVMISNNGTGIDMEKSHIASHKNLREINFYINNHFSEQIDLNTLAEVAHLTPKYLSKRFIELSGTSISQYISDVRLNYAKNLIVSTKFP